MKTLLALLYGCLAITAPLAATTTLAATISQAASPAGEHPLLDLARELESSRDSLPQPGYAIPRTLHAAEHALNQAQPPADEDCAHSLGAPVFAQLHSQVGQAHTALGDFAGAAQAYRRALACTPRSPHLLHALADSLFSARDLAGAAEHIERARELDPRAVYLTVLAANIDFVTQRWADAVSRYRYAAASEPDRTRAAYWQLMYWLAQARAGMAQPGFVARRHPDDWPRPLLLYLQDQYSEAELVGAVREGNDEYGNIALDERLCEALFYVGEAHLARGDQDLARRYLAAAVNVRMIRFNEHGLALAEIARLPPAQARTD